MIEVFHYLPIHPQEGKQSEIKFKTGNKAHAYLSPEIKY